MTQHTITLSDLEEKVVSWLVDRFNTESGTQVTIDEWLHARIPDVLRPAIKDFSASREAKLLSAFRGADEKGKQDAETALNVPGKS